MRGLGRQLQVPVRTGSKPPSRPPDRRRSACWTMTTSPSPADVSLERRSVNAGVKLAPYRAGYRDSGSNVNFLTPQDALFHLVRDRWLLNWWWRGRGGHGGGGREGRGEPRCGGVLLSGVARRSGSRGK